jgi:dTDP-4-amino-4,6-dideoxygalactose transaminase
MQKRRIQLVEIYNRSFSAISALCVPQPNSYTTAQSWSVYVLRLVPPALKISRDQFISELDCRNIGASVHFKPLHLMTVCRSRFNYKKGDFPKAEEWFENIVSLPIYPTMTEEDAEYVVSAVKDIVDSHGADLSGPDS